MNEIKELKEYGVNTYNDDEVYEFSIKNPHLFWDKIAKSRVRWFKEFDEVCNTNSLKSFTDENFDVKWFSGGKLNATVSVVDRHYETTPDKIALIWEHDEPETQEYFTYRQLYEAMNQIANMLKTHGIKKGDCVAFYVQASFYCAAALLACSRIGATFTFVFAEFPIPAIVYRINEAQCVAVITDNQGLRCGKRIELKKIADEAINECPTVKRTFVINRTDSLYETNERVVDLLKNLENYSNECQAEPMDSEDPLYIVFTSGTTGKPKALVHTHAGFIVSLTFFYTTYGGPPGKTVSMAIGDCAWVSFAWGIFGILSAGNTVVLFDSSYLYPNPGRIWETIERLEVTAFSLYPAIARDLMTFDEEWATKSDLSKLRSITVGGDLLDEKVWRWLFEVVCRKNVLIFDGYGESEIGSPLAAGFVFANEIGSGLEGGFMPIACVQFVLLDEEGIELPSINSSGQVCIPNIHPGILKTIKNNHEKYLDTYFRPFPGYFYTGDFGMYDANGFLKICGRGDEVMKIRGLRISNAEVEDSVNMHKNIVEAVVVGEPDEIYVTIPFIFIVIQNAFLEDADQTIHELKSLLEAKLKLHLATTDVPIHYLVVKRLPKTRTGKILRRVLRKIVEKQYNQLGDLTSLEDASCVDDIVQAHKIKFSNNL